LENPTPEKRGSLHVKADATTYSSHNPYNEVHRVSRLRENLTSGSEGEGLETGNIAPRQSFTRQTAFQSLAQDLNSEINTLGYPRAALFGFCVALVSYIIISVIKSALGRVHGINVVENQLSGYYLADEISGTYRGMMIAVDQAHWVVFQHMTPLKLSRLLEKLASNVKMS
jgi:hypothetical protein